MKVTYLMLFLAYAHAQAAQLHGRKLINEPVSIKLAPQQFYLKSASAEENVSSDEWLVRELMVLEAQERNLIVDVIVDLLESFRDVVINGNDVLPPLDPLVVDHIGPFEYITTGLRATANIRNLRVEGLRWYVVDDVHFNAFRLTTGLHLTLPWFTVSGEYDVEARIPLLPTNNAGGRFRVFLNRLEFGVDLRLGTNLLNGHLVLRELDIKIDIHDTLIQLDGMFGSSLINNAISSIVQSVTQDLIQSELQNISQMLSEELFDVINDILKDYTLADILG